MPIIARDNRREWTPAPEGLHDAVCVDVVDLGNVTTLWGDKHKVRIIWQIEEINPDTGRRHEVRADYGCNLSKKGKLRPALEVWRGRKFTDEEAEGFDVERLVGAACQIQIIHNITDEGRTYANVQAVVPPAKGVPRLSPQDYVRVKDRAQQQETHGVDMKEENDAVPF